MRVAPGNAQHIGDRERQEDAFGFSSLKDSVFERHGGVMTVLCDGMGGLANGAAASRAAVDAALCGYNRKEPSEDIPSALNRAVRDAHQAVCNVCEAGGTAGSTIVMAVVWQDRLYWASLGDSRLYLCRGDAPAVQLTEDHNVASLLEQGTARGESSASEAASGANPDALTAYLGAPYPPQPHTGGKGLPLQSGDRIVACSDGLYRGLSPEAMSAIARRGDPMTSAEQMIRSVLKQKLPHQDNLTAVLLKVSPHHGPIEIIKTAGPKTLGALYGAVGGFGTAVALAIVLIRLGVLSVGHGDRSTMDGVTPPHSSPGMPSKNGAPPAQPPTTGGGKQQPATAVGGSGSAPARTHSNPTDFLPPPAAGKKSSASPNGSDNGPKGRVANPTGPPKDSEDHR